MTLNNEILKEIKIKQDRLRTLLDIESMFDDIPESKIDDSKKDNILKYSHNEKNNLMLEIISQCNIHDLDHTYFDNGSPVTIPIEDTLNHVYTHYDNQVLNLMYDEFVSVVANYDITELLDLEIIVTYLSMIYITDMNYSDTLDLKGSGLKKIT